MLVRYSTFIAVRPRRPTVAAPRPAWLGGWPPLAAASLGQPGLVGGCAEQPAQGHGAARAHLGEPARAQGVAVDLLGIVAQRFIDGHHRAIDRAVVVIDRFHRLDLGTWLALAEGGAKLGEFDMDDVADLAGGEAGQPNDDQFALRAGPFVSWQIRFAHGGS